MAITLEVETGSASPTANSYVSVGDCDAFWEARGGSEAWSDLGTEEKKAHLVRAFDYLRMNGRYQWRGSKRTTAQRGPWPRTGASERHGGAIASTEIPWQVRDAQCLLAPRITDILTFLPDVERGGMVVSESLSGVYSATYDRNAPPGKVLLTVDGVLGPLMRTGRDLAHPTFATTKLPDVFLSEHFSGDTDSAEATDSETT